MKMADPSISTAATASSPVDPGLQAIASQRAPTPANMLTAWPDYMVDALQRSVLFLHLLRQRGDEQIEITSSPLATVLSFGHEVLMDGCRSPGHKLHAFRIVPPPGIVIDPRKRPVW